MLRVEDKTPQGKGKWVPSVNSRHYSAKLEEGWSRSSADSPSAWGPAITVLLFLAPGSTPTFPHLLAVGVGVTRACESQQHLR